MNKLFYILFFFLPIFGFSQTDTIAHMYTFGGLNNDNAEAIDATADGGYIVVGSTSSNSSGNTDIYLLKVDSLCNYEWSFAIGGTNNDWGYAVKQTFDKGFIIAASSNSDGNGGYNAVLYKRDSLGNHQWTKRYGGQDWDFAYDVVQTYDSGFVFCGETYNNTNGFSDVYVVKTNNVGDTLWTKTIGGALVDKGNAIIETSDSNIVIAGIKNTVADSTDIYLLKFSNNGVLLWDSVYNHPFYDVANSVIETFNNDFVVGGANTSLSSFNDKDFYLLRTNKDGVMIWENNYTVLGDDEIFDLKEDVNGNLINVGHLEGFGAGMKDSYMFYLNPGGFWLSKASTFGGIFDDVAKNVVVGNNGDMVMVGYTESYGFGLDDLMLVRIDTIVTSQQFTVDTTYDFSPLIVVDYKDNQNSFLYPNPASGVVNFASSLAIDKVEMFDIYGRKVKEVNTEGSFQIKISDIPDGIYTLLFYGKGQRAWSQKLIILNK